VTLTFGAVRPTAPRAAASTFCAPECLIRVEVETDRAAEPGAIAGFEGLGCELFFDAGDELVRLDLTLPLFSTDVLSDELLPRARAAIREAAIPGAVIAGPSFRSPLNADAAWLGEPFGDILLSFDELPLTPPEALLLDTVAVEVGAGTTVGVGAVTHALRFVLVEGFAGRQQIFGTEVEPTEALDRLHLKYLSDPDAETFAATAAELNGDELARRLAEAYRRALEVDDALTEE
jgi:hypothetical protein